MKNTQPDMTDIFHQSKALLNECRREVGSEALRKKLSYVSDNLAFMYGQLALLEDQGSNGIDHNQDLQDEGDEELW